MENLDVFCPIDNGIEVMGSIQMISVLFLTDASWSILLTALVRNHQTVNNFFSGDLSIFLTPFQYSTFIECCGHLCEIPF